MRGLGVVGIFVGVLLLIVAIPTVVDLRVDVAGVASSPIPTFFAIFIGLIALAGVFALVLGLMRKNT